MKKIFVLAIALSIGIGVQAQNSPEQMLVKFFQTFGTDRKKAVSEVFETNQWIKKAQPESVKALMEDVESLNEENVGKFVGYEIITEKKINTSCIILNYMAKFERQPIRCIFTFYKPEKTWVTQTLTIDFALESSNKTEETSE